MPRLRKMRRKQKYGYHINRKRLDKKLHKLPRINCDAVREAWDDKKSLAHNLSSMGLVSDPNADGGFRIPTGKEMLRGKDPEEEMEEQTAVVGENAHVVNSLEQQARDEFKKKKESAHPLPPEMYRKLCKFIDKYGEDYEAMAKDHTNYYQETPKQLKKQIERLKNIPQQWVPYLKSRGLVGDGDS